MKFYYSVFSLLFSFVALSAQNGIILNETFEGALDSRISIDKAGDFSTEPSVISTTHFGSNHAFTYGNSNCQAGCYDDSPYNQQPYRAIIRIIFPESLYIDYLSFKWSEMNGNWGSGGHVFIDGEQHGSYPEKYIGISPPSEHQTDESVRTWYGPIQKIVNKIEIAIWDISNGSQILIDDIIINGDISSINDEQKYLNDLLTISPNPTSDFILVKSESNTPNNLLHIFNLYGQKVYSGEMNNSEIQIDVSSFPAGVYFVVIGNVRKMFIMN